MENGTWAPAAAKAMKGLLEGMKQVTIAEPIVTIRSVLKDDQRETMRQLADNLVMDR